MKNIIYLFPILLVLSLFFTGNLILAQNDTYDILIKNASILDGSLKEPFIADVAIAGDIIVKIAPSISGGAKRVIDAEGLYLCPGFIDLHSHADESMTGAEGRACLNYLKQGVTTLVLGQCGRSAWPKEDDADAQIRRWSKQGIGPNAALLVGHGQVREMIMGNEQREPTPEELKKMKDLVRAAMEQGACGISTGLEYIPGSYSKTDEVVEVVGVVHSYGGIHHTHIRNEGESGDLIRAVEEAVEIAKKTGVPTHISHIKASHKPNWGLSGKVCEIIEEAQRKNLTITADQYPFRFGGNSPYKSFIPRSAWIGGESQAGLQLSDIDFIFDKLTESELIELYKKVSDRPVDDKMEQHRHDLPRKELVRRVRESLISLSNFQGPGNERERSMFLRHMKDPEELKKIREGIADFLNKNSGADDCYIVMCPDQELEGKTLTEVAVIKGKSIEDTAIELELMGAKCITTNYNEDDIEYFMKKDWVATGSDGIVPVYGFGLFHIRSYSAFLHKIKRYALEKKTVSLPFAIRSQTSLAARIMNFNDRGWIKEGYKADMVVLDLKNIKTRASVSHPHQYSEGVKFLFINGEIALDNGEYTGRFSGKVLKRK